jgi:hypothetical protein
MMRTAWKKAPNATIQQSIMESNDQRRALSTSQLSRLQDEYDERELRCDRMLCTSVERLERRLEARARSFNKKRRTKNECAHWQARGRQELLRGVADHLQALRGKYSTGSMLYFALKDYLGCLEKYEVDVQEEKNVPGASTWPVEQWKAEGAAHELPIVFTALTHLLYKHLPLKEQHILSLDGKRLVPLQNENGRTSGKETAEHERGEI